MTREKIKELKQFVTEALSSTIDLSNKLNEAGIIIKALISGIDSIFYIKNTELFYLTANDAFMNNLSLKTDFVSFGKTDRDFFSSKEAKENAIKDERVLITKEKTVEEGFIPGSKKRKWGIITRIPIFDLNDNIVGLVTSIVDITDRKKTENKNKLLQLCIENMSNTAVSIYESTTEKIIYANEFASELTGFPLEEICNEKK